MPVAARLMSLWSGDLIVLPAASNSLCWRVRNSTPWKLTSFHSGGFGYLHPHGPRDVHHHRRRGGTGTRRNQRTDHRWLRICSAPWYEIGKPIDRPRAVFRHDQVLQLHGEGLSGREIARRLGVGEGTERRALNDPGRLREARQNPSAGTL